MLLIDVFLSSILGTFKYGLYEVFKNVYSELLGEENAYNYRTSMYLVGLLYNLQL